MESYRWTSFVSRKPSSSLAFFFSQERSTAVSNTLLTSVYHSKLIISILLLYPATSTHSHLVRVRWQPGRTLYIIIIPPPPPPELNFSLINYTIIHKQMNTKGQRSDIYTYSRSAGECPVQMSMNLFPFLPFTSTPPHSFYTLLWVSKGRRKETKAPFKRILLL